MLRIQLQELLNMMELDEYHPASLMAKQLAVSEKTVRNRIKELKSVLNQHGGDIVSKSRYGYKLVVTDEKKFKHYLQEENESNIPETIQERNIFLLKYLLELNGWVKMDDLCDMLYISKSSLSSSIRNVEKIMNQYNITIERKPNYGISVRGDEFDLRRLLCHYFIKNKSFKEFRARDNEAFMWIAQNVQELLIKYEIHLTEIAFDNFIDYVYIGFSRTRRGYHLNLQFVSLPTIGVKEISFQRELVEKIEETYHLRYSKDEKNYILLYLAGKQRVGNAIENDYNFVIREEIDRLALGMMERIKQEYHMDFCSNFELRMTLNQHLVALDVRLKYGLPLTNPMLDEIKKQYCLAYDMALQASAVLRDYYKTEICEDEVGYIALIFALALNKDTNREKMNILVVCNSGKNLLKLLKYQYEQSFSDYVDQIYVEDKIGLEKFDFSLVDYVFTTVPITWKIPCPIFEISVFLGENDVQAITNILERGITDVLRKYYTPERFLTDIKGRDKDSILKEICDIIMKQEQVGDDFYELVLEREKYAQMKYGNKIAIPHPNRICSPYTFAYVAVLPEEVLWNGEYVQVIFLTSVSDVKGGDDSNRQKFYKSTAQFALNREYVQQLIDHPDYETLMKLIEC